MKRRMLSRILSLALAAMCLLPVLAQAEEYATVQGGGLNLREKADLNARVLGQYWTGTWVEIVEKGEEWCKVKVAGKDGYMMSKFLKAAEADRKMYVRTNTGIGLNLRKGPGTQTAIITSFPIDTEVTVLEKGKGWYKVKVGCYEGYMASAYLSASKAPAYTKPLDAPVTATMKNINGGKVVNFRLYPGMKTKIIQAYPVGTQVKVLEKGELWCKVEIEGKIGYVSTYMLKF